MHQHRKPTGRHASHEWARPESRAWAAGNRRPQPTSLRLLLWSKRLAWRMIFRSCCRGALALVLTGAALAQPGVRIDPGSQSRPPIRIGSPNPVPAPTAGPLGGPPIDVDTSAGPRGPEITRAPAARYQGELNRLRQAAQPASGYGSTRAAAHAAWVLGLLDLHGGVVALVPPQAATWFERATRSGHEPLAWAGVAWCAIDGCESPPDPAAAQAAINRLRPVRRGLALYLQWVLDVRHEPVTLAEVDRAQVDQTPGQLPQLDLLRQAAAAGDAAAQNELGIAAAARDDYAQARADFQKAASNSPAARANLQLLAQRESRPTSSPGNAADALFVQAQRFHRGDGVPVDYARALRLYQEAASQGSLPARRMLELILSRPTPNGTLNIAWMAQLAQVDVRSGLPQIDAYRFADRMLRDPTPLFGLIPAPWLQRILAARNQP